MSLKKKKKKKKLHRERERKIRAGVKCSKREAAQHLLSVSN